MKKLFQKLKNATKGKKSGESAQNEQEKEQEPKKKPNLLLLRKLLTDEEQVQLTKDVLSVSSTPLLSEDNSSSVYDKLFIVDLEDQTSDKKKERETAIPSSFSSFCKKAASAAHSIEEKFPSEYVPFLCECLSFSSARGKLKGHVDCIDSWILVFSLGCSANFWYKLGYESPEEKVLLQSGDAVIFDGGFVAAIEHGITEVLPDTCPSFLAELLKDKRLSVQFRDNPYSQSKVRLTPQELQAFVEFELNLRSKKYEKTTIADSFASPLSIRTVQQNLNGSVLELLPEVIVLHILSFLDMKSLSQCALVSHVMRKYSNSDYVWKPKQRQYALDASSERLFERKKLSAKTICRTMLQSVAITRDSEVYGLVMDCGSYLCRIGNAGLDAPQSVFRTIAAIDGELAYVGDDALKRLHLEVHEPVKHGIITDYSLMEKVLDHALINQLAKSPELQPFLWTERPYIPRPVREKTTEILFEKYGIPAGYVAVDSALALYACGRTTGVVVDIGHDGVVLASLYEGYVEPNSILKLGYGAVDSTKFLFNHLGSDLQFSNNFAALDIFTKMKHSVAFVSEDPHSKVEETEFKMPDGKTITVGSERMLCGEGFFDTSYFNKSNYLPLHKAIEDVIVNRSPVEVKKFLWGAVTLCGGGSLLKDIDIRLKKELQDLTHDTVTLLAAPERAYSVWIGGSILASLSTFQKMWMSKEEYDESGPTLVNRKCF